MSKIVYVGAVELSQVGLDELLRQGAKPELVVTLRPDFDTRHSDFADLAKLAAAHGIPVHLVDNINEPALMERLAELRPDAEEQRRRDDAARPLMLVLPGSRRSEIHHLMPVFGEAVAKVAAAVPGARFVLPAVERLRPMIVEAAARWQVMPEIVSGEPAKLAAFREARVALAASGTVTLELALSQVPTVAAYRGANWEAFLARRLIKLPSVILPNLILGRSVVPEFIQEDVTADALGSRLLAAMAEGEKRREQLDGFAEVEAIMRSAGPSPAANAVAASLALLRAERGE